MRLNALRVFYLIYHLLNCSQSESQIVVSIFN